MVVSVMSGIVVLIVLSGAVLHAGWNALVKASTDKQLDMMLVMAGAAVLAMPFLPFLPAPAQESWKFLALSGVIHLGYFTAVAAAYQAGEMTHVYPLMRGTAPLLVALGSFAILGEAMGLWGWAGVLMISGGVVAIATLRGGRELPSRRATAIALGNALVIAGYTYSDGIGARLSVNSLSYTMWVFLAQAILPCGWMLATRPAALAHGLRTRWHIALIGGACTLGSYGCAIWAMTQAPLALVAALRESSILFAMLIGMIFLGERIGWGRAVAGLAIIGGIITLRITP